MKPVWFVIGIILIILGCAGIQDELQQHWNNECIQDNSLCVYNTYSIVYGIIILIGVASFSYSIKSKQEVNKNEKV